MRLSVLSSLLLLSGSLAGFGQPSARPNFSGHWKFNSANSEVHDSHESNWTIEQSANDMRISSEGGGTSELRCNLLGQECDSKGRKVTMYFNGPKLVVLDTEGKHAESVVKRRLSLSDDGNSMQVEVFHIVPPGPVEKLMFQKQAAAKADEKLTH